MTKNSGDARMQPLYFQITTAGNIKADKEKSTEKIDSAFFVENDKFMLLTA